MAPDTTIGDTINLDMNSSDSLCLSLEPQSVLENWSRISDTANFIADFYNNRMQGRLAHNTISTVLNELIENAVKFAHEKKIPVEILTSGNGRYFIFRITNTISEQSMEGFRKLCDSLFSQDLNSLYLRRIDDLYHSRAQTGIGLILLKKDYRMDLNFEFPTIHGHLSVTVTAKIGIE